MKDKWIEAYNRLIEIINEGESYYKGSDFLDIVRKVTYNVPPYQTYIDKRKKENKSTSRKDIFWDVLAEQNEPDRKKIFEVILKSVQEYEPEKSQKIADLLEVNLLQSTATKFNTDTEIVQCKLEEISIKNFYVLKNINLINLSNKNLIFLLGENGSGKTLFLKALLIKLKEFYIQQVSKEIYGVFEHYLENASNTNLEVIGKQNEEVLFNSINKLHLKNLYAYGTNRTKISETSKGEQFGFMTLFKDDEFLINTEEWIKNLERKELKKETQFSLDAIEKVYEDFLGVSNLSIQIEGDDVWFLIQNEKLTLQQLSEGYRSIIVLITDLLARLIDNNPQWESMKDFEAVVLIDELDLFLHPSWERKICQKLYQWFPKIQFFITTHSPILIDGAVKDKGLAEKTRVYRFEKNDAEVVIKEQVEGSEIQDWMPNILISSPLFDTNYIEDTPTEQVQHIRTENSYAEMLETEENLQALKEIEAALAAKYKEDLKKEK